MTGEIELYGDEGSPFDAIKQVDGEGEFWSARDIARAVGYSEWRNFERCVLEARAAIASLQGEPAGQVNVGNTTRVTQRTGTGSISVKDYRLTRYGAYMTLLHSSKPELKHYFAVKTRQAEVMEAAPKYEIPETYADALEAAARAVREAERVTLELESAQPKVVAYDAFIDVEGLLSYRDTARLLRNEGFDISEREFMSLIRAWGMVEKHGYAACTPHTTERRMTNRGFMTSGGTPITQRRFTKKGLDYVVRKLLGHGDARRSPRFAIR